MPAARRREDCSYPQHASNLARVDFARGKIVERFLRYLDDVALDERRTFGSALLRILEAAFPFEHRPAVVIISCKLGKDRPEIDLSITERSEPRGPLDPWLEARIDALASIRIELRILHVEGLDALVIDVDEGEIIELLQEEVRGVVVDAAALVVVHL